MYLVDTNVISAGARAEDTPDLAAWMDRNSSRLYLSTVTIAEIEAGIAKLRRTGSGRKATALTQWLDTLLHLYAERVLTFDVAVARMAGRFSDVARAKGRPPGFPDVAIAATAKARDLVLLTRNVRHFTTFDIEVHDPFRALPS
ncbi:MAG: type II toxin-antitoxin system VapC family toxin [Rhodospirillaceae bacterium]|nr:type II toxin-antitoxin system VapC family toxin [Rhodospirillaceae bacterium]